MSKRSKLKRALRPTLKGGSLSRAVPENLLRAPQHLSKERQRAIPYAEQSVRPTVDVREDISPAQKKLTHHTEIYTLITQIGGTRLIYSAESWVKVRLNLETAGPVAVSTRQKLEPVLSGRGALLVTDEPMEFTIPKGDRLFYSATAINRVRVTIEPVPWLEQMLLNLEGIFSAISRRNGR
jgi:hypothetical protein